MLAVAQVLRQALGVAVQLVRVGSPVVLELGAVHRHVPDGLAAGHGNHFLQLREGVAVQFFLLFDALLFLLLREVQHEGVLPLDGIPDLTQQQNDNHREMNDRGDEQSCLLIGRESHFFLRLRCSSAFSTVVVRTSIATWLWPPCGTMMSA